MWPSWGKSHQGRTEGKKTQGLITTTAETEKA